MNSALFIQLFRMLGPLMVLLSLFSCQPHVEEGETIGLETVSPESGALAGGTTVTLTGSGFKFIDAVRFGDGLCTDLTFLSYNKLTCKTPANLSGSVDVTATGMGNKSSRLTLAYTYQSAPLIASVTPSSGFAAGGTDVVISGSGFIEGAVIRFGGAMCSNVTFVDSNTIICKTPARGSGIKDVILTNPDTQNSNTESFTFVAAPLIYSLSPNGGPLAGGTIVTITGSGFEAGTTIRFGATDCPIQSLIGTTILTCTAPGPGAGAVTVTALNTDGQTSYKTNGYTYRNAPAITSISVDSGALAGGTVIWVTGTNFSADAVISLGGTNCTNTYVNSSTSLICVTAAHAAGLVDMVVTNADTQTGILPNAFTYRPIPLATSVSPSSGPITGGTPVTITGTGFVAGATVKIGGVTCGAPLTVVDDTTITCTTGAHASGAASVVVTNYDTQYGTLAAGFTYIDPPTVTAVSPGTGFTTVGTSVTITGTGFLGGATVDFDGSSCTGVTVVSSTSITCTTPTHAAGPVTVTVTNTDSQSGALASGFTYVPPPTVSSVSPNSGTTVGGTNVTITGTDFVNGATVDFGGSACSSVSVVSSTSITCTTTVHASGAVTVKVTNPDTQFGLAPAYTYQTPAALAVLEDSANPPPAIPAPVPGTTHDLGVFGVDFTYIYTIENTGEMATSNLNVTLSDTASWGMVDNCSGSTLPGGGTCTVEVTFTATTNAPNVYITTLEVNGVDGENLLLDIQAEDNSP